MNGSKIDVSELSNITTGSGSLKMCDAPVDSFNIVVHQLTMCTSDPIDYLLGNTTENPCVYLWNTSNGDDAISFGVTKSSETTFPATLPPTGVYTHGYASLSTSLNINIELEFDEQRMIAGNSDGTAWHSAPALNDPQSFVGGGNRTMTMKDFKDANYYGFTELFSESQSSLNNYIFKYNSFSGSAFVNRFDDNTPSIHNGNTGTSLLLNDNDELATDYNDAKKLLVTQNYSSPITITDQVNTIIYKYSPDLAARVTFSPYGVGNWIVTSIIFGNSQFDITFE
tara:strand:+ start:1290 stop:2138 length:849 start_codon:yes stop_codon:yes gene_type:complete